MTDSYYQMSDMCATCGERYGQHCGMRCPDKAGQFVLAAKPPAMTDSYHYQIEPEPRADGTKGTFEVHADGSVSGFLKYGGTYFHESAERLIECGHANADEYAKVLVALGYKRIDPTTIGPFGSGATLKTSGDKIVGRVEAGDYPDAWESLFNAKPGAIVQVRKPLPYTTRSEIATYDVSVGNSLLTAEELHSAIRAVLDSFRAQDTIPEPIRPALDWNTAKPFDTFGADFIVTKGAEPTSPLHTSPTTDSAYPAIAGLLRG